MKRRPNPELLFARSRSKHPTNQPVPRVAPSLLVVPSFQPTLVEIFCCMSAGRRFPARRFQPRRVAQEAQKGTIPPPPDTRHLPLSSSLVLMGYMSPEWQNLTRNTTIPLLSRWSDPDGATCKNLESGVHLDGMRLRTEPPPWAPARSPGALVSSTREPSHVNPPHIPPYFDGDWPSSPNKGK